MDRLECMQAFVKTVELGSLTAAGDAMDMSPQLVGKYVRALEQQLDVKLLHKTTRKQHLTDIGEVFYHRAKSILTDVAETDSLIAEAHSQPTGTLRINAPKTFGIKALTPAIKEFATLYPKITIELTISNHYVDLIDGGYDCIFRVGSLPDSSLIARALAPYKLVLCAAPSYLESAPLIHKPSDLVNHQCLSFSHTELKHKWTFIKDDQTHTVAVNSQIAIDNGEALLELALLGGGIILQPEESVLEPIAQGKLIPLLTCYQVPERPMHLLYAKDRRMTPKLRYFIDYCIERFGC